MRCVPVVIALVSASACRGEDSPRGPLETTMVPCIVPAGASLHRDAPPLTDTMSGPQACEGALVRFFDEHPDMAIVDLLPIQYPVIAGPWHGSGTQDLLVVHSPAGDVGVPAGSLFVDSVIVCAADAVDGQALDDPARFNARACEGSLRLHFTKSRIARHLVVPLVEERRGAMETSRFLVVAQKRAR